MTSTEDPGESPRERILQVATQLLAEGGHEAVSTRAICARAGVQAPTIYRLFGDKQGLLDTIASEGFSQYLADHGGAQLVPEPLDDLRLGWDAHLGFALANPYLYALVYGDPSRHATSPTALSSRRVVAEKVHRLAEAGLLAVGETLAVDLLLAAGSGTALSLIATPPPRRDPALATTAREAVVAAITTSSTQDAKGTTSAASGEAEVAAAVRTDPLATGALSSGERALLGELLDRITRDAPR